MKTRQTNSTRASALRITLSAVLISISAVLLASSFKAAPATNEPGAAIVPGFGANNTLTSESWTFTGSLHTGRFVHTATLLPNGKVLVAGGSGNSDYLTSAELYDPASGSWTLTGSLNTGRELPTATLLPNGKVLVAGGHNDTNFYLGSAELYDPTSGSWTPTGSLNIGREYHTATLLPNGKVLVAAGGGNNGWISSAELYDPASGSWTVTGGLHTARLGHTTTLLPSGKVLVAGGNLGGPFVPSLTSAELYDPVSGTWTVTGSLNTGRTMHTAILLPNGRVLVAGGFSSFVNLNSAELYDPASGTWTAAGSLNIGREYHTATLLPGGNVLVAGGLGTSESGNGVDLASAELYDPVSESWTLTGSLNTARGFHTATLLPNGKVFVAGGSHNAGALSSAELYDTELEPCSVCHKRTVTLSLECGSEEYQRHLDHRDTLGPCPAAKKDAAQTDSLGPE